MGHSYYLSSFTTIFCAYFVITTVNVKAITLKTRIQCCSLGTNYSNSGSECATFQSPVTGVPKEEEAGCLSIIDVCCKKQLRILQCNLGKEDAFNGNCQTSEGERKECCEACQMGIETSKSGEQCTESLGFFPPYDKAFTSCCEDTGLMTTSTSTTVATTKKDTTTTSESLKYATPAEENSYLFPGLSEENVCETGEFCAQLCEPTGNSYKCACFKGYTLMADGVSCKPEKRSLNKGGRCAIQNPCDHDCFDTGTAIKCSCREGYELMPDKITCKDIDECALNIHDCAEGEDCINEEGSFDCLGPLLPEDYERKCPTGFKFNSDKGTCDDVDECQFGLMCAPPKVCKNTVGAFLCEGEDVPQCPPGFHFKAAIDSCADIDECISGQNDCNKESQVCLNTKGNYTCIDKVRNSCPAGFKKNDLTQLCEDINECEENFDICKKDEKCVNEPGAHTCVPLTSSSLSPSPLNNRPNLNNYDQRTFFNSNKIPDAKPVTCPKGFRYNLQKNACDDIDECLEDPEICDSNQNCFNSAGSYACVCKNGFTKDARTGACVDVNECQVGTHNCQAAERCDNTVGSFHCARIYGCGTGYTLNYANGLCEDDDECLLATNNCHQLGPNYKCRNTAGSYRCEAVRPTRPYIKPTRPTIAIPNPLPPPLTSPPQNVYPIPPSPSKTYPTPPPPSRIYPTPPPPSRTPPTSPPRVYPTPPAYSRPYYTTPTASRDHPTSPPYSRTYPTTPRTYAIPSRTYPISSNAYSSTPRTYPTVVSYPTAPYYTPARVYPTSPKVIPNFISPVPPQRYPIISGQHKKCLPGYRMNERGDCEDIDECESNPCPERQKCLNFNGRYECSSPLQCKIGYEINDAGDECIDVNECARGTHKCNPSQICKNGHGYYSCECPPGHHLSRATQYCEDIDECKFYRPCGHNAQCVNTKGSYHCTCKNGFKSTNNICEDINECTESPGLCEHNCVNLWGSYRCACKPGFILNYDNRTCSDVDECERFKDKKICVGTCKNVPGSYVCECPKGYKLGSNGRVCLDIDECEQNVCGSENVCLNTRGGYKCYQIDCPANYVKDPDHKARCKRLQSTCDVRDYQCILKPEQYTYQYMTLVSNLPLSNGHIQLFQIKGPQWRTTRAEFSLSLLDVTAPPGVEKVNEHFFQKVSHQFNSMQLFLIRSIQGPQEMKLQVEMKLYQGTTLIGNVVVYIIIVVSEHEF